MTQRQKAVRFIFQIPRGKEERWRLYCKILREFDKELTAHIWRLIESDMDEFMRISEIVMKTKVKKNE